MDFKTFLAFDNADLVAPIGLSFGINGASPDLFLIEIIGDRDSPVRYNGKIVAFTNESGCRAALQQIGPLLPSTVHIQHKYDFVCDIPGAINILAKADRDQDGIVLNCVNTLLDLVATSPYDLPHEYTGLYALADHLTFREEFALSEVNRLQRKDALLWCAGNTVLDVMVIRLESEFNSIMHSLSAAGHNRKV